MPNDQHAEAILSIDYQSRPWRAIGGIPEHTDRGEYVSRDQLSYTARCLEDVPYLAADLEITASRQDRFPSRPTVNGDGSESPLPYREGALRAAERLAFVVTSVAALVWHRATAGQPTPRWTGYEAAGWLLASLDQLAHDPDAEQLARRICEAHDRCLEGPIEHPPEWRYLGRCPSCGDDLEAQRGQPKVQCPCGWTADTQAVIDRALEAAQDMLLTDTQLVGALELDGRAVTRDQIKGWHARGRLAGHEQQRWAPRAGRIVTVRTYRLSEVRNLVSQLEARRTRRV